MKHLIILQSGFCGSHFRMFYIKKILTSHLKDDYEIVISDVNNFLKTFDGIENGGKRLANFTKKVCLNKKPTSISFIGHSLGGLYIRACIGILNNDNFFDTIIPNLFVTIATPHLGATCNRLLYNCSRVIHGTTKELFLNDDKKIIEQMSLPNSSYINGLNKFYHRIVYGNVSHDFKVGLQTACICSSLKTKIDTKNKLILIDHEHDCVDSKNKICNNLYKLNFERKAINLGLCWNPHCTIAGIGLLKKNNILYDIVHYFLTNKLKM